jgi:hypothetical protein
MSQRATQPQAVTLGERLATHDRRFARYQRHATEVIANAGVLSVNSDAMDSIFAALPENAAESKASDLCRQIADRASDKETHRLTFELDGEIGNTVLEERDRAYLLGLAVGLQVANAGKDGAR